MNRSIKQIQSELNRAMGQLDALEESSVFNETDRNDLRPKWQQTIKKLENELNTAKAKDIKVDAEVIEASKVN